MSDASVFENISLVEVDKGVYLIENIRFDTVSESYLKLGDDCYEDETVIDLYVITNEASLDDSVVGVSLMNSFYLDSEDCAVLKYMLKVAPQGDNETFII